ncbi:MAG: type II secretion system protein [Aliivibrio sp.]|uniref:type II secretion system protein n=1 Tax=Aliivibrio sp. TaxID=1872443 RepID=UPI001A4A6700|nr:type II secretion system protein [Aliivibrio sp.]
MKKQAGFTLIELVVVIVILGILAVTAAPKFLNLQTDARVSALKGLKGAMQGASSIVYAKAAIDGKETSTTAVDVGGVQAKFGYPTGADDGIGAAITGLSDWEKLSTAVSGADISYSFDGNAKAECSVSYSDVSTSGDIPTIDIVDSGC